MPNSSQLSTQNTNNERPKRTRRQPEKFRDVVPDGPWFSQGEIRTEHCDIGAGANAAAGGSEIAAAGGSEVAAAGGSKIAAAGASEGTAVGRSEVAAAGDSEVAAAGGSEVAAAGGSEVAAAGGSEVAAAEGREVAADGLVALPACEAEVASAGARVKWGEMTTVDELQSSIDVAYSKIVTWKKNLFEVPTSKCGKDFVAEAARLLQNFNARTQMEPVALNLLIIFIPLMLQKPARRSKTGDHKRYLTKRLKWWRDGKLSNLLAECEEIQRRLCGSKR